MYRPAHAPKRAGIVEVPHNQQASTQRVTEQWGFVVEQSPKINQFHRPDESQ